MKLLRHCTIVFAVLACVASVQAQVATTRIIVGFPPGTGLDAMGMEVTGLPPAQLSAIQKADSDKWGPVIRASGIRLEE